jgi:hypothetical protein
MRVRTLLIRKQIVFRFQKSAHLYKNKRLFMIALAGTVGPLPLFLSVGLTCWLGAHAVGGARDDGAKAGPKGSTQERKPGWRVVGFLR